MIQEKNNFAELSDLVSKERIIAGKMVSLLHQLDKIKSIEERKMAFHQLIVLKNSLKKINSFLPNSLEKMIFTKPPHSYFPKYATQVKQQKRGNLLQKKKLAKKLEKLERDTLKRLKKKEAKTRKVKPKKPNLYIKIANKMFAKISISLLKQGKFKKIKKDLVKANLQILPKSYVSVMFFTTLLSEFFAVFAFIFFLFFNIGAELPIITLATEGLGARFLKVFWILFVVPIATFLIMYVYPSLEQKSIESKIDQELPFATIHMSSISGSMVEPSKIFSIIISTKEYPHLQKEFIKIINEINIFGHDLVTALRNMAYSSPSRKLAELFNGLATTITSGGNLPEFFDKRAQSLLFDYRIEREKYTKSAETFMDIYISVVIAAPMILMLLLMMMKISGLGISLSTSMISLMMVLGVSMINIVFLTFLHLKQPTG